MKKLYLTLDLQLFADEGAAEPSGVEVAPAAEVQSEVASADQPGVETQAAAEPEKQNNFEKAFAKRLSAEREKWEQEVNQKYQGHEDYKFVADYLQQANGLDLMTLKERIELERLQARAEEQNVPPEVLKRIDELEAKASKAEMYEQHQQQLQHYQEFRSNLEKFASEKGANADELHAFMYEKGIANMEVAYKAMRADELEQKLQTAEKDAINKYLDSKKAPKAEGSGAPGITTFKPTGNLDAASERALERFRAARQSS